MRILLAVVLLLPIITHAAETVTVGRLFFSPEQRAQLDTLRIKKVVAIQTKDEPAPEIVTYNGIVRRSDGKATVWVNNKALTESELRDQPTIAGRISRDGQILLQSPQAANTTKLQLKVGQRVELLSGQVDESFTAQRETSLPKAKPETANKAASTAQTSPPSPQSKSETPVLEERSKAPPQ